MEVERRAAPARLAAEDRERRLDVGVGLGGRTLGIRGRVVLAGEGRGHEHDGGPVARRVGGDPLEGIDGAEADIALGGTELLDGLGIAIGDLAFLGGAEVLPRGAQVFLTGAHREPGRHQAGRVKTTPNKIPMLLRL